MKSRCHKIAKPSLGVIGVILAVTISYQVRELAAALLIFSLAFVAVGTTLLLLILVQEAALRGTAGIETCMARVRLRRSIRPARTNSSSAGRFQLH